MSYTIYRRKLFTGDAVDPVYMIMLIKLLGPEYGRLGQIGGNPLLKARPGDPVCDVQDR
jgi:hypothetical protein